MVGVCFDMDGVLVDSEDHWVEREREDLFAWLVPDDRVPVGEITGMHYGEIYEYLAEHYAVDADWETYDAWFQETAREIYLEEVELLPGTHALFDELHRRDATIAIVSSSPRDWIALVVDRFDLTGDLEAVVSAEDVDGPGKPAPGIYEHAADVLGEDPSDCVAVEDSEHGIAAAVEAGMACVAYDIDAHDDFDLSGADVVARDPEGLAEAVIELVEARGGRVDP